MNEFAKLSKIPGWRRKLSNFWDKNPMEIDGKQWKSVEHYYQASKFKKEHPEFYASFSLDSGSDLSEDPLMAKGAGGKNGKFKGSQLRPVALKMDKDFFETERNLEEMNKALKAKFTQHSDLKQLLKDTNKSVLMHFVRGRIPERMNMLMKIREEI